MTAASALGFGAAMLARGIASGGGVALSVVVARTGGADLLGQFVFALSVVQAGALLGKMGLDVSLMRMVARLLAEGRSGRVACALRYVLRRVSLAASAIATLLGLAVLADVAPGSRTLLGLLTPAVLALAALGVVAGYLRGRRRTAMAALVEIGGLSLVTAGILAVLARSGVTLDAATVAAVFLAVALVAAVGLVGWSVRNAEAAAGTRPDWDNADAASLRSGSTDFALVAVAGFLTQAGVFVLIGPVLGDVELGLARAAERLALLVALPSAMVAPFIAPRIVAYAVQKRTAGLRSMMRKACLASVALALPPAALFLAIPELALGIFGPGFAAAAPVLRLLALANLCTAASGPFLELLMMTGRERVSTYVVIGSFGASVALYPAAAVVGGAVGFAAAFAAVNACKAVLLIVLAARGGTGT